MEYALFTLRTQDGEREYYHRSLHRSDSPVNWDESIEDYCANFWSSGYIEKLDDGEYDFGEVITSVHGMDVLTSVEYDILRKYIS